MDNLGRMLANRWTTIIGCLLGALYYIQAQGATMPTTRQGWWNLAIGALVAALGIAAKDATTGSPPGAKS